MRGISKLVKETFSYIVKTLEKSRLIEVGQVDRYDRHRDADFSHLAAIWQFPVCQSVVPCHEQ
jgi:hypothetical protein